jgi:hypothetical protein
MYILTYPRTHVRTCRRVLCRCYVDLRYMRDVWSMFKRNICHEKWAVAIQGCFIVSKRRLLNVPRELLRCARVSCTCVCAYVCVYVCMCICLYVCVWMYVWWAVAIQGCFIVSKRRLLNVPRELLRCVRVSCTYVHAYV